MKPSRTAARVSLEFSPRTSVEGVLVLHGSSPPRAVAVVVVFGPAGPGLQQSLCAVAAAHQRSCGRLSHRRRGRARRQHRVWQLMGQLGRFGPTDGGVPRGSWDMRGRHICADTPTPQVKSYCKKSQSQLERNTHTHAAGKHVTGALQNSRQNDIWSKNRKN